LRVAGKKLAQVLSAATILKIAAQKAFDGVRHLVGRAAIANRTREGGMLAHGAAQTEVVGVLDSPISLDLFAFQANIGYAVLAAAIGTPGNVEFELLVKFGKTFFQFFHQPAREGLGFCDCELAELAAGAGNGAAPERRSGDMQAGRF